MCEQISGRKCVHTPLHPLKHTGMHCLCIGCVGVQMEVAKLVWLMGELFKSIAHVKKLTVF